MKTIATIIHNNTFPLKILDSSDNIIYFEVKLGIWYKSSYNLNNNQTYYMSSSGFWREWEYDLNGQETYYGTAIGFERGCKSKTTLTKEY